jgi:hypothetical protein
LPDWGYFEFKPIFEDAAVKAILGPIRARYDAATKKREQEILATPIDDQAWAEELKRRADFEAWRKALKTL